MQYLYRTKSLLDEINIYLDSVGKTNRLETFLIEHILIVFCSEVEAVLLTILRDFIFLSAKDPIKNFLDIRNNKFHNGIKKTNLADTLGHFSLFKKRKFNQLLEANGFDAEEKYSIYLKARDIVAHRNGQNLSLQWADIKDIVNTGEIVIDSFKQALNSAISDEEVIL